MGNVVTDTSGILNLGLEELEFLDGGHPRFESIEHERAIPRRGQSWVGCLMLVLLVDAVVLVRVVLSRRCECQDAS